MVFKGIVQPKIPAKTQKIYIFWGMLKMCCLLDAIVFYLSYYGCQLTFKLIFILDELSLPLNHWLINLHFHVIAGIKIKTEMVKLSNVGRQCQYFADYKCYGHWCQVVDRMH